MKKVIFLFCILLTTLNISGQSNSNIPKPEVIPTPEYKDTREEDFQKRMDEMNKAVRKMQTDSKLPAKLTKEEKDRINEIITPDKDDLAKYEDFLKQSNTGIFRLMPDYGCEAKNMLRVDGICENHVPGRWSYSLRLRDYSNEFFHDLWFADGNLISEGLLSQAIIFGLGDVSLENVSLPTNGINHLLDFDPATDKNAINSQYKMISKGFEKGGFFIQTK
jgi:hypothetical protein